MSGRPRPDELPNAVNKVLHILESLKDHESVTHAQLVQRTGLSGRLVFAAISWLDGRLALIGGAPSTGYRLARHKGDGVARDRALASQSREMLRRRRRRRTWADTLPEPEDAG